MKDKKISPRKLNKTTLSTGILFFAFGFLVIINPDFYHYGYGYHIDFSDVKWPVGLILMSAGSFLVWHAYSPKNIEYYICPKCKTVISAKDVPNKQCIVCGCSLEDLRGFYDRHPELKENKAE